MLKIYSVGLLRIDLLTKLVFIRKMFVVLDQRIATMYVQKRFIVL